MKNNRNDPAEQHEPVIPIVSHGGGVMLRELVKFMRRLDVLYPDGLQQLEFTPPSSIVLSGQSPEYPLRAKAFAERRQGQLRWNSAGWVIMIDIKMPDMVGKTPMRTEALLETLSPGWPALGLVEGPIAGYINTMRFNIDQSRHQYIRFDRYSAAAGRLSRGHQPLVLQLCRVSHVRL